MKLRFWSKKSAERSNASGPIALEGGHKERSEQAGNRIIMIMAVIGLFYATLVGKLLWLGLQDEKSASFHRVADLSTSASRPKLLDRNGNVLAMDIKMVSLFAEPKRIEEADEAVELLSTVLPDLNYKKIHKWLSGNSAFKWIKRELTPKQQSDILALGIPGIGFRSENRRFYPGGATASHVLGHVDIDNKGIAGVEKYLDDNGLADLHSAGFAIKGDLEPVTMSIDLRVQHVLHDELSEAMKRYQAIAAGAVVLDVHTGEVRAMVSLPDFDPNDPKLANRKDRLNRMSAGLYEMGSTFKTFTSAMALDSGKIRITDSFDASRPLQIGRFKIKDFHGKRRSLSVPEIFIYSSNIGTAKMARKIGIKAHKEFLTRLGLLTRLKGFELPEVASPHQPKKWKQINSATISFGHGVMTTPLQTAVAAAALMNGGKLIPPTLFPRSREEADKIGKRVVSEKTSGLMRYLFRLNALKGSGRKAKVPGYLVGGKTGTAEKVVRGRYSSAKRFNAFLSAFPMNDPQYVVLVVIDEPKPEKGRRYATAGWNAAPTVAAIVKRAGPLLGVQPDFRARDTAVLSAY